MYNINYIMSTRRNNQEIFNAQLPTNNRRRSVATAKRAAKARAKQMKARKARDAKAARAAARRSKKASATRARNNRQNTGLRSRPVGRTLKIKTLSKTGILRKNTIIKTPRDGEYRETLPGAKFAFTRLGEKGKGRIVSGAINLKNICVGKTNNLAKAKRIEAR